MMSRRLEKAEGAVNKVAEGYKSGALGTVGRIEARFNKEHDALARQ